mgnify:CR=1 FL=1
MKGKLRQVTLCLLIKDNQVLLAMKKRGFGKGKWNGVGGKLKEGETLQQAAIREAKEEIGVTPLSLRKVAVLDFYFPEIPADKDWNQQVVVFEVDKWKGEPVESEEMAPKWFDINEVPFDDMWPGNNYWMTPVFAGKKVRGELFFAGEGELKSHKVQEVDRL